MREIYQEAIDRKMCSLHGEGKDNCERCEKSNSSSDPSDHFSPNIEAFDISGEIVCDDCAEEIFEENDQFGMGA